MSAKRIRTVYTPVMPRARCTFRSNFSRASHLIVACLLLRMGLLMGSQSCRCVVAPIACQASERLAVVVRLHVNLQMIATKKVILKRVTQSLAKAARILVYAPGTETELVYV